MEISMGVLGSAMCECVDRNQHHRFFLHTFFITTFLSNNMFQLVKVQKVTNIKIVSIKKDIILSEFVY